MTTTQVEVDRLRMFVKMVDGLMLQARHQLNESDTTGALSSFAAAEYAIRTARNDETL